LKLNPAIYSGLKVTVTSVLASTVVMAGVWDLVTEGRMITNWVAPASVTSIAGVNDLVTAAQA
jgi:hypothetical protein